MFQRNNVGQFIKGNKPIAGFQKGHIGYWLGRKRPNLHSQEIRNKISEKLKGRKKPPRLEKHRRKISESLKGRKHPNRRKPPIFTDEHKIKISEAKKGHIVSEETKRKIGLGNKGKKLTEETRKKMSLAQKGKKRQPHTEETKKKMGKSISMALRGKKRLPFSNETKRKMSLVKIGNKYKLNKKLSKETKQKMRIAAIGYIKRVCGNICPRIGRNEKQILDKLEQELNHKVIRQYECKGYYLDGYIPEINLAIEIDERPKILERDIEREKIIKEELGCEFLRIKDYD